MAEMTFREMNVTTQTSLWPVSDRAARRPGDAFSHCLQALESFRSSGHGLETGPSRGGWGENFERGSKFVDDRGEPQFWIPKSPYQALTQQRKCHFAASCSLPSRVSPRTCTPDLLRYPTYRSDLTFPHDVIEYAHIRDTALYLFVRTATPNRLLLVGLFAR